MALGDAAARYGFGRAPGAGKCAWVSVHEVVGRRNYVYERALTEREEALTVNGVDGRKARKKNDMKEGRKKGSHL